MLKYSTLPNGLKVITGYKPNKKLSLVQKYNLNKAINDQSSTEKIFNDQNYKNVR